MRFKYDIDTVLIFDSCIVVMIEPPVPRVTYNENIFGVSFDGKILWQIEKTEHLYEGSRYTNMVRENDLLLAYNWDGFDYLVNPATGKIISMEFGG